MISCPIGGTLFDFVEENFDSSEWLKMTDSEIELCIIVVSLFCVTTFVLKQNWRKNAVVFLLACFVGFLVQLPLGRELNLYTSNIKLYIFYVSLAVMITWGIGLTSVYAAYAWVGQRLRIFPGVVLFSLCCFPIVTVLEIAGSNIVHMKLHDYMQYAPLMPQFQAMHAPPWLYGYYFIIQLLFYGLLKALRMLEGHRQRIFGRDVRVQYDSRAAGECE